jgi:flagellar assembly protein FliH
MASHFTETQQKLSREAQAAPQGRIIKGDPEACASRVVSQHNFGRIQRAGEGDYQELRSKYGPLAATDPEHRALSPNGAPFAISPMLKDRLAIGEEERRAIEERVEARIAELKAQALEEARAEGLAQGFEAGKNEALARYNSVASENLDRLEKLVQEFDSFRNEIYAANERQLIDLVFRVSRMLFLKDLSKDRDYVMRLARLLVERVGARENIRIRLHPQDQAIIEELRSGLVQSFGSLPNLMVEVDPAMRGSGIQLETRWNAIDASIDTQFESIYGALMGEQPKRGSSTSGAAEANASVNPDHRASVAQSPEKSETGSEGGDSAA